MLAINAMLVILVSVYTDHTLIFTFIFFNCKCLHLQLKTREGFLRKNIVAVSFFQNCAIHQYS